MLEFVTRSTFDKFNELAKHSNRVVTHVDGYNIIDDKRRISAEFENCFSMERTNEIFKWHVAEVDASRPRYPESVSVIEYSELVIKRANVVQPTSVNLIHVRRNIKIGKTIQSKFEESYKVEFEPLSAYCERKR